MFEKRKSKNLNVQKYESPEFLKSKSDKIRNFKCPENFDVRMFQSHKV